MQKFKIIALTFFFLLLFMGSNNPIYADHVTITGVTIKKYLADKDALWLVFSTQPKTCANASGWHAKVTTSNSTDIMRSIILNAILTGKKLNYNIDHTDPKNCFVRYVGEY